MRDTRRERRIAVAVCIEMQNRERRCVPGPAAQYRRRDRVVTAEREEPAGRPRFGGRLFDARL
jgi:hypothetical protein